jgi:hypothetical protein
MKYLSTLGPAARLRLHHEVTVAVADEQYFESLGCHPKTGMLKALAGVAEGALLRAAVSTIARKAEHGTRTTRRS